MSGSNPPKNAGAKHAMASKRNQSAGGLLTAKYPAQPAAAIAMCPVTFKLALNVAVHKFNKRHLARGRNSTFS